MSQNLELVPKLVAANLDVIEAEVLSKLPAQFQDAAVAASNVIKESATVLVDDNPMDAAQLADLWKGYVVEDGLDLLEWLATDAVTRKVKDLKVAEIYKFFVPEVAETIRMLLDSNTKDDEQIKEYWKNKIKNDQDVDQIVNVLFKPLLSVFVKNDQTLNLIAASLATLIKISF